jgi:peptide/nickel transport system substrate-binding protein
MTRILMAMLACILLAGASAHAQTVLRIGLNDDPDALDPTISRAYVGRLVFAALCDKLFDVTPDLKIVPQLATSYEWAGDNRSVILKLRSGVKFHDGEPFNAEAVKFNIERHLTTQGSFRKSEIGDIKSVDVVNDTTVRLNLGQPLVPLLAALTDRAGMMVSPKAAKELGDRFGTRPVCAGPFKFVERVAQGKIVLQRLFTSTASSSCRSPTRRHGWRASARAICRSSSACRRPTWRRSGATASSRWSGCRSSAFR